MSHARSTKNKMSYTLYMAEKELAGENIALYLSRKLGKPATKMRHHFAVGDNIKVGYLRGHLLEMAPPHAYDPALKDWKGSAHMLPYVPNDFILGVKDKTKSLFDSLRALALNATEIINCADPDDQGELLSMQFLHFIGCRKPVKRLMALDLTDKGLQRAFERITPASQHAGSYFSALAQSHADWLYGINMTRACTLEAEKKGVRLLLNVGRVKTPTWALIVKRELAIRTFVPQDHFKPWIDLQSKPAFRAKWSPAKDDVRLDPAGLLIDAAAAQSIVQSAQTARHAVVTKATTEPGQEQAPLVFALNTLQSLCSKRYGWSPTKTLEVAQMLYLKRIISYPRSPLEYLPEDQHELAPGILQSLAKAPLPTSIGSALRGARADLRSRVFDDGKLKNGSHHGIVPTELANPALIAELSEAEKTLYCEIVKRYVLQFWPAAKVMLTQIELECGGEPYAISGKRYVDEGWRKAFAMPADEGGEGDGLEDAGTQQLPELAKGMMLPLAQAGLDTATTKPPKRYTQGTLLEAMSSVHTEVRDPKIRQRLREKEGLGTEATRHSIIEETVTHKLFRLGDQKDPEIIPSEDVIRFIGVLPDSMTAPDMTALWQIYFDGIKEGKNTYEGFIQQQTAWLRKMAASVASFFETVKFDGIGSRSGGGADITLTEHECTACQAKLKRIKGKFGWFFACSNDECKKLFSDLDGMPVEKTAPQASDIPCPTCAGDSKENGGFLRRLARGQGKAGYFWGCSRFKEGCRSTFDDLDGKPDLDGTSSRGGVGGAQGASVKCPQCEGGHLRLIPRKDKSAGSFWGCSAWRTGCRAAYNDDGGQPDFEGKTRQAGAARLSTPSGRPAAPAPRQQAPGEPAGDAPRWGSTRPAPRSAAGKPAAAPLSFAERARRHGGPTAYDPLADL